MITVEDDGGLLQGGHFLDFSKEPIQFAEQTAYLPIIPTIKLGSHGIELCAR